MSTHELELDTERRALHTVIREHFRIVEEGDFEAMSDNVTEGFVNIRSAEEPSSARQPGAAGLRATSEWLRGPSPTCTSRSTTSSSTGTALRRA
jgi:hypothetical protein